MHLSLRASLALALYPSASTIQSLAALSKARWLPFDREVCDMASGILCRSQENTSDGEEILASFQ